jgi:hypothetical protein
MTTTPPPPHEPSWHLLSTVFPPAAEDGIVPPHSRPGAPVLDQYRVARTAANLDHRNRIVFSKYALRLVTPSPQEPEGYESGKLPRKAKFPAPSVLQITADPWMPPIAVECKVSGFNPQVTPIRWRLVCEWTHCRYEKQNHVYRYQARYEPLRMEWQGRATSATFRLFADPPDQNVLYDYNPPGPNAPVMGGHAVLSVAVTPGQGEPPYIGSAHLLIGGTNPDETNVMAYVDQIFAGRDVNLARMMKAIFAHESGFEQFSGSAHSKFHLNFTYNKWHKTPPPAQPPCPVDFVFPPDPANFPKIAFDWGIGISQYTLLPERTLVPGVAWDWRVNSLIGVNLFLVECARKTFSQALTWRKWAELAYKAYNSGYHPNGVYSAAANAYAQTVGNSPQGQEVSNDHVPPGFQIAVETDPIESSVVEPPVPAPSWPPGQ